MIIVRGLYVKTDKLKPKIAKAHQGMSRRRRKLIIAAPATMLTWTRERMLGNT
jgi:hypothetical protein